MIDPIMFEHKILIVEDEDIARDNQAHILANEGYETIAVDNGLKGSQALEKNEFDLVITDLKMPKIDGMKLLEIIKQKHPHTEILIITGYATVNSAVEAMQKGAYSYVPKPFKIDELRILVKRALEKRSLFQEVHRLRQQLEETAFPKFIGQSEKMELLKETISQIATVDCTVLINGETGTGKELVARSIHKLSPRSKEQFVAINCASFNEELLGNELFGHEDGAFTGAKGKKKGLLEVANGGTFFLDEIGDMPLSMQAKMLRVLEERTLIRIGGIEEIHVDIRVLAATNKDLLVEVENGSFRKDLYYRLNVVNLQIPRLAERCQDVALLAYHFLNVYNKAMKKNILSISNEVMTILEAYEYPGNVRELENIIERAVVMCNGETILPSHLPTDLTNSGVIVRRIERDEWIPLANYEQDYVERVLEHTGGNKTQAAKILGIDRVSLWRKMQRYCID
jgi:DNA-binding NtrC family response regulator